MTPNEEKKAQIEAEKAEIEKNIQKFSRERDAYREMLNQCEHDWAVLDDQELAIAYQKGGYLR